MKLIDTNVFINAWDESMEFNAWAEKAISDAGVRHPSAGVDCPA